jgi:hypothetical protein
VDLAVAGYPLLSWNHDRGLATTGTQGYDPALIQVRQTGPTFWVGYQQATESGLLFILIAQGLLVLALVYVSVFGKSAVDETARRGDISPSPGTGEFDARTTTAIQRA